MKDFIIIALDNALIKLDKQTPLIKKQVESISIIDVNPIDINRFMLANDIPNDAYFNGRDNGYDVWDDICLSWTIDVPTTDKDRLKYRQRRFTTIAHKNLYDLLIANGYKRVGFNSGLLRDYDNTTVYDMYIDKDYDRLIKYYSLSFNKL
jgi:hypothetical protein